MTQFRGLKCILYLKKGRTKPISDQIALRTCILYQKLSHPLVPLMPASRAFAFIFLAFISEILNARSMYIVLINMVFALKVLEVAGVGASTLFASIKHWRHRCVCCGYHRLDVLPSVLTEIGWCFSVASRSFSIVLSASPFSYSLLVALFWSLHPPYLLACHCNSRIASLTCLSRHFGYRRVHPVHRHLHTKYLMPVRRRR